MKKIVAGFLIVGWIICILGLVLCLFVQNDTTQLGLAARAGICVFSVCILIWLLITIVFVASLRSPTPEGKPSESFSQTHSGDDIDGRGAFPVEDQMSHRK